MYIVVVSDVSVDVSLYIYKVDISLYKVNISAKSGGARAGVCVSLLSTLRLLLFIRWLRSARIWLV